ncbi:unnamed protein product [Effrenium voratum]|uniref:Uncharacterized protein n=1 Tax=Effrenium voratum TaxID=2562239 RepID=A0AA36JLC3_9DINO|nr:unnamed protein product [Effrenium voratum]
MAFHYFTPDEARMALASIMAIDEKSYKLQEEREQDRNARDTALPLLRQLRALRLRRKLLGVLLQTLAPYGVSEETLLPAVLQLQSLALVQLDMKDQAEASEKIRGVP